MMRMYKLIRVCRHYIETTVINSHLNYFNKSFSKYITESGRSVAIVTNPDMAFLNHHKTHFHRQAQFLATFRVEKVPNVTIKCKDSNNSNKKLIQITNKTIALTELLHKIKFAKQLNTLIFPTSNHKIWRFVSTIIRYLRDTIN